MLAIRPQTTSPAVNLTAPVPSNRTHSAAGATRRGVLRSLRAYSYRVPLCVPFWNARTYWAIVRCCLTGRLVYGPDAPRLERRLAQFFALPSTVACAKARVAIELALRAVGVGPGDEVIVPTFCCASVLPPIQATGAVPVFADVGANLYLTPTTVEAACTPATRAVIVAHLYGNPAPIDAVVDLCRERRIAVIDDAAQALGARSNGQLLGTFGDAGVISFGNGKVCFGTGGGFLIARNAPVLARARSVPFERAGSPTAALSTVLALLVWRRWRRWTLPLQMALPWCRSASPFRQAYRGQAMRNVDAAVAMTLLHTLEENLCARRARVAAYQRLLEGEERIALLPHQSGSACLTQVVQVAHPDQARHIIRSLRAHGYEVSDSYRPLHLEPGYACYLRTPLTRAEQLWARLVELPCEPSVPLTEVERIAAIVRQSLTCT